MRMKAMIQQLFNVFMLTILPRGLLRRAWLTQLVIGLVALAPRG